MAVRYELQAADGPARLGLLHTPHGTVETPAFMAVGTAATVKGLTPPQLQEAGVHIVLGNTYHLALRPGDRTIADLGGLHRFMNWRGPILTDSGGYQVFSLAHARKITDHSVVFRSHIDGRQLELSPERAVEIQQNLGSDMAMCLDECPPGNADPDRTRRAVERTLLWAERCQAAHTRPDQALFAIVQGGTDVDTRGRCAEALVRLGFPGYALGGFSVGEPPATMHALLPACAALLPADKPRYLMGVGRPVDLVVAVAAGIDLFDCVLPTRNGRNATAFVAGGLVKMRNSRHRTDPAPLEEGCDCYACRHCSRAYLHHLFSADEMLGPTLLSLHNLRFYQRLMASLREAIRQGRFAALRDELLARWLPPASTPG